MVAKILSRSAALLVLSLATSGLACPKTPGFTPGPFVPDAATARAIFLAVERARAPNDDLRRFPVVEAEDHGDQWVVFRYRPPERTQSGWIATMGGGQLAIHIDKCDGAISHVVFSR